MLDRIGGMDRAACQTALTIALLALPSCDPAPGASEDSPLQTLGPTELAGSSGMLVVDARDRADFDAGHIAGAVWLDPGALRTTIDDVEGQVVPRATAETIFGEAGLSPDDSLVVTGVDNGTDPARVAWTLRYYGHRGSLSLLDGGMLAWASAGEAVTTDAPARGTTGYVGQPTLEPLRVDKAWMLEHVGDEDVAIFDVRTPDEYAEGHIPGAANVNWTDNVGEDGRFLDVAQVQSLHGEPGEATLVVYCRTGSRAAVSWALLFAAGYEDVRLYDGSWTEWGSDPDTPKE